MERVLVANRGEIACRVMRSCYALGLETVAVYSEPDRPAKHVDMASVSAAIGGTTAAESYLRIDAILDAATRSGADAIHPGYGFLSESARFAHAVEQSGRTWVGPRPKSISNMGDKGRARAIARQADIPILEGSAPFTLDNSVQAGWEEQLYLAAKTTGFPLLVKATAGGGGIGMRRVDRAEDLVKAVTSTQSMAQRAFEDGTIYLEPFITNARHVEIQVFGFGDGNAIHLRERDCSIQRRFQKVIEESPAPGLSEPTRTAIAQCAIELCRIQKYRDAGTVEFVVDSSTQAFYFLEMNTRIQVEHAVTEMNTGTDLIAMQLQIAAGWPAAITHQSEVYFEGHAIECRIYAERPAKNFLPSTGELRVLRLPKTNSALRVETGVREGDHVTPYYDPMLAKVIAHGNSRNEAVNSLCCALRKVQIEGVETNLHFLLCVLEHPEFRAGRVWIGFIEQHKSSLIDLASKDRQAL